jgi:hypothetical protein
VRWFVILHEELGRGDCVKFQRFLYEITLSLQTELIDVFEQFRGLFVGLYQVRLRGFLAIFQEMTKDLLFIILHFL